MPHLLGREQLARPARRGLTGLSAAGSTRIACATAREAHQAATDLVVDHVDVAITTSLGVQ